MNKPERSLFTEHPGTDQETLIQYNKEFMNSSLVMTGYADAAQRLADSYRAEPWDDVMLLPFLFLWRQAIELALKTNIRCLAEIRRQAGDADPSLDREAVIKRLRSKIGHDLTKLIDEEQAHIAVLGMEAIPEAFLKHCDYWPH